MALYEYRCRSCGQVTERRMPMSNVQQRIKCPACGKQAQKVIGAFSVIGRVEAGVGDGPAPWDDGGDDDGGAGDDDGLGGLGGHGHSHGPGGHTH